MGTDKALLKLAGRPLVEHAVEKLRRVCAEVHIVGSKPELAAFAPVIPDLHPGCGPLGGMEAAMASSQSTWSLFTPVDMPFFPSALLNAWVRMMVESTDEGTRIGIFASGGRPQPVLCLMHRDVRPFLHGAVEAGELKVLTVLEDAARALATKMQLCQDRVLRTSPWTEETEENRGEWERAGLRKSQMDTKYLWFANLNTPEDLREAEKQLEALDFFSRRRRP
jgi:molybdopterin-guanine dinucleotide biosynthesis protein A